MGGPRGPRAGTDAHFLPAGESRPGRAPGSGGAHVLEAQGPSARTPAPGTAVPLVEEAGASLLGEADVWNVTPGAAWLHVWFQVWEEPGRRVLARSQPHAWSPEVSSLPSSPPRCLAPSPSGQSPGPQDDAGQPSSNKEAQSTDVHESQNHLGARRSCPLRLLQEPGAAQKGDPGIGGWGVGPAVRLEGPTAGTRVRAGTRGRPVGHLLKRVLSLMSMCQSR